MSHPNPSNPTSLQLHTLLNPMFLDFNILAHNYPKLYSHLVILDYKTTINFRKHDSLIVLAQAIMWCIFGIRFQCPWDNLCPRIPCRLNYLLWVYWVVPDGGGIGRVLDVGTGATLIYPLLGWSVFKWDFIATDTNPTSITHAHKLCSLNNLTTHITLIHTHKNDDIFSPQLNNQPQIDVVICNPPFYDNNDDTHNDNDYQNDDDMGQNQQVLRKQLEQQFRGGKKMSMERRPIGRMLRQQFSCEGGEYQFFFNMYRNSFSHVSACSHVGREGVQGGGIRIKYFSCLLGRQTSFNQICKFLQYEMDYGVLEYLRVGEIRQGHNARFAVLWRPVPPTS